MSCARLFNVIYSIVMRGRKNGASEFILKRSDTQYDRSPTQNDRQVAMLHRRQLSPGHCLDQYERTGASAEWTAATCWSNGLVWQRLRHVCAIALFIRARCSVSVSSSLAAASCRDHSWQSDIDIDVRLPAAVDGQAVVTSSGAILCSQHTAGGAGECDKSSRFPFVMFFQPGPGVGDTEGFSAPRANARLL